MFQLFKFAKPRSTALQSTSLRLMAIEHDKLLARNVLEFMHTQFENVHEHLYNAMKNAKTLEFYIILRNVYALSYLDIYYRYKTVYQCQYERYLDEGS